MWCLYNLRNVNIHYHINVELINANNEMRIHDKVVENNKMLQFQNHAPWIPGIQL
jgi:hypothetical protein